MSPADRARAAHAAAELATHPADRAAARAAAAAWEALSRPGQPWSYEPTARALASLQQALAAARLVQELRANGGPAARELAEQLERRPAINPARVTPTGVRYHVTGVQPAAIEF